jgi:hypothetical protein
MNTILKSLYPKTHPRLISGYNSKGDERIPDIPNTALPVG